LRKSLRMEFPELVRHMCQRPSMWVRSPDFSSVCAYISGFDQARDGGPLDGFREWLIVRLGGGNNLTWDGLVEMAIRPEADSNESPTEDQEASRLKAMAELFDEFFRSRDEEDGIAKFHYEYARWLLSQEWYTGPLRKKRE
jgi:hypothetical protein